MPCVSQWRIAPTCPVCRFRYPFLSDIPFGCIKFDEPGPKSGQITEAELFYRLLQHFDSGHGHSPLWRNFFPNMALALAFTASKSNLPGNGFPQRTCINVSF
jgi:hypothetical protein